MPAAHKKAHYKPLPLKNPFKAGQDGAYADILLHVTNESKTWRRTSFLIVFLFILNFFFFIISMNQQEVVPLLVNVMPSGKTQFLGEVRSGSYQVSEAVIHYEIRKFVSNLRTVSTDYQIVYEYIDLIFNMSTRDFVPVLRQIINNDSPFEQVGRIRRTVDIESVLNITGRSYNINWTEHVVDSSGRQTSSRFRAVVTIRLTTPTSSTVIRNPSGVYIENFEMTELR